MTSKRKTVVYQCFQSIPFNSRIHCTHLSLRYLIIPRDVILTPDSRTKTDVKKKLNIFRANCNSYNYVNYDQSVIFFNDIFM